MAKNNDDLQVENVGLIKKVEIYENELQKKREDLKLALEKIDHDCFEENIEKVKIDPNSNILNSCGVPFCTGDGNTKYKNGNHKHRR
jgi:hypothetical protein